MSLTFPGKLVELIESELKPILFAAESSHMDAYFLWLQNRSISAINHITKSNVLQLISRLETGDNNLVISSSVRSSLNLKTTCVM